MYLTGVQCACAHIARRGRKTRSGFHDTISNDFIDTTFLRSNAAELQLYRTHMCRYLFSEMTD